MSTLLKIGILGFILAGCGSALAQPEQLPEPLNAQNFEHGIGTWLGLGPSGKLSLDDQTPNMPEGANALRFDYQVAPGQINLVVNPISPPSLATLQSIHFWVKLNHNATLVCTLQEQNGGRFGALFTVTKDRWQRVELSPSEFLLQTNKDDPKDANGQLDPEKIQAFALLDLDQIFVARFTDPNSPEGKVMHVDAGPRTLEMDDVVFSGKPLPALPPENPPAEGIILDDFSHPQAGWLSLGGVALQNVPDADPKNNVLQADYGQSAGRIAAFVKQLPLGILTGKTSLSLNVVSKETALVMVQVEENGGGKYGVTFPLTGGTTPTSKTLNFSDFKAAQDSKDDNGRLDLDQIKQLLVVDVAGFLGMGTATNTLWLNQLRAK